MERVAVTGANGFLGRAICAALGREVRVWRVPEPLLHAIAWLAERQALWRARPAFLTRDKVRDLSASSWLCDASALRGATDWRPRHTFDGRTREIAAALGLTAAGAQGPLRGQARIR